MNDLESVVLFLYFRGAPVTPFDAMRSLEEARAVELAHVEFEVFLAYRTPKRRLIELPEPLGEHIVGLALAAHPMPPTTGRPVGVRPCSLRRHEIHRLRVLVRLPLTLSPLGTTKGERPKPLPRLRSVHVRVHVRVL